MRRVALIVAMALALAACSQGDLREVDTNSGGTLDCHADLIAYSMVSPDRSQPGATSALAAVASAAGGELVPDGDVQLESESSDVAVVSVTNSPEHRIGRAVVSRSEGGWYVQSIETCG